MKTELDKLFVDLQKEWGVTLIGEKSSPYLLQSLEGEFIFLHVKKDNIYYSVHLSQDELELVLTHRQMQTATYQEGV